MIEEEKTVVTIKAQLQHGNVVYSKVDLNKDQALLNQHEEQHTWQSAKSQSQLEKLRSPFVSGSFLSLFYFWRVVCCSIS